MLRYFRKIWVRHTDGSALSTAVNCCDLVRVFVTTAAYANMKKMGSELTLTLLTWRVWRVPNNDSRWQMGFNSAFNTRSAGGGSLPESASGSQIDRHVLYRLLIISC